MIILDETTYRQHGGLNFSSAKNLLKSPLHYKAELEKSLKKTSALIVGTMTHSTALEDEEIDVGDSDVRSFILQDKTTVVLKPEGMSFATKDGKKWRDEQLAANPNAHFLSAEEKDQYIRCTEALKSNKDAQYLLSKCDQREIGIVQKYRDTTIKGKIDAFGKDEEGKYFIFDLKTSAGCSPEFWSKQVDARNYAMQMSWYQALLSLELQLDYVPPFYWVVVEKTAAADVAIYQPSPEHIAIGQKQMEICIEKYVNFVEKGKFPGYGCGIQQLPFSKWEFEKWMNK